MTTHMNTPSDSPQKTLTQRIQTWLTASMILYISVCIPLALTIYTPYAHLWYCPLNPRCDLLSDSFFQQSVQQLTAFLQHQTALLQTPWSHKEALHMLEVRGMYDQAAVLFFGGLLWIAWDVRKPNSHQRYQQYVQHSLYLSIGLLLICALIMPFFKFFWLHIFHPLLFNNQLWRTDPADISWYLMPRQFFMWVIGFIVLSSVLLQIIFRWLLRIPLSRQH